MTNILLNLGMIILLGVICMKVLPKFKIPTFLGFLILGIILGPYGFNFIDNAFLGLNEEICTFAMIILLVRAGLGLSRDGLRKIGRPAVEMSFIPSCFEGFSIMIIGHYVLNISFLEAGMLGFILASVAPAVLVPRMLKLTREGFGIKSGIPTLLLTGSSADDVIAITIFSSFLSIYLGGHLNIIGQVIGIPISIIIGMFIGIFVGIILLKVFKFYDLLNEEKLLLVLAAAILVNSIENILEGIVPVAGLVGVMVIGFLIIDRSPKIAADLSTKFSHIWLVAELVIFVLLGSQIQLSLIPDVIIPGLIIIVLGLAFRIIGVYISLLSTKLNRKEKLFCMVSYIPKANAQATIGGLPLAAGVGSGQTILAITGIAIIITAPLGAILIDLLAKRLLNLDEPPINKEESLI